MNGITAQTGRVEWRPVGGEPVEVAGVTEVTIRVDTSGFADAIAGLSAAMFDARVTLPALTGTLRRAEMDDLLAPLVALFVYPEDHEPFDLYPDDCWKCDGAPGMEELDGACWPCWYALTGRKAKS